MRIPAPDAATQTSVTSALNALTNIDVTISTTASECTTLLSQLSDANLGVFDAFEVLDVSTKEYKLGFSNEEETASEYICSLVCSLRTCLTQSYRHASLLLSSAPLIQCTRADPYGQGLIPEGSFLRLIDAADLNRWLGPGPSIQGNYFRFKAASKDHLFGGGFNIGASGYTLAIKFRYNSTSSSARR